ncbi:MAG: hypothetical protein HYU77_14155 [Betaproteobacteria bacterium]|nr:hypothetical protein [Betaproteobacteria bacterium]
MRDRASLAREWVWSIAAFWIKTVRRRATLRGVETFDRASRPKRKLLVGADGIRLEEFFSRPAEYWIS